VAVGAPPPTICYRQQAGWRRQYRHRGGRARIVGRLYAAHGWGLQRDQRDVVRQAQFQFHSRRRAGRRIVLYPNVMLVHPSVPAKTVPQFIAHARANAGRLTMASSGIGSPGHVAGELFKMMTGVNMVHVPYRGSGPALTDLLGGQVQVSFPSMASSIEYVRAGKLRAMAVATATRSEAPRDVPTVGEFVPGYEASGWYGIGAPRATPVDIVDKLNKEVNAALDDPKMKARLADLGGVPLPGSPAEFGKLIADETEKWAKVIKF